MLMHKRVFIKLMINTLIFIIFLIVKIKIKEKSGKNLSFPFLHKFSVLSNCNDFANNLKQGAETWNRDLTY